MLLRFCFGCIAVAFIVVAIRDRGVDYLTIRGAAPTLRKLSTTIFARIFFVTVALTALRLAILDGGFRDLAVDAAPTIDLVRFTESGRFFSGWIALTTSPSTDIYGRLNDLAVNAAPTFLRWATVFLCFFFGWIALTTCLLATCYRRVPDISFVAAPTTRGFWRRRRCYRITGWRRSRRSFWTTPRILKRFFSGRVARTIVLPLFPPSPAFPAFDRVGPFGALSRCAQDGHSVLAAPAFTPRRWRRRWRRANWWRTSGATRQRPIPTRRWLRRTWWMFSGRSTPLVATAIRFPAPAPSVLFPNPLATLIVPLPAGDSDRRHLKSVFVTVLGNSIADDDARIADRARDGQNFELTLRKIAEHVEIVHFVADIKKRVFGIVTCC